MQSNHLPEIETDPKVQALISHFDAVIQSSQNATHFSGVCGMSVQIGESEFMPLPHTYLAAPVSKAELVSEVRAALFARQLLQMSKEQCAAVGGMASKYESAEFMALVRKAYQRGINA